MSLNWFSFMHFSCVIIIWGMYCICFRFNILKRVTSMVLYGSPDWDIYAVTLNSSISVNMFSLTIIWSLQFYNLSLVISISLISALGNYNLTLRRIRLKSVLFCWISIASKIIINKVFISELWFYITKINSKKFSMKKNKNRSKKWNWNKLAIHQIFFFWTK